MKNRAVRIALFLLAVLAFGGAGYEVTLLENQANAARSAAEAFQQKTESIIAAARELRAAQYAYVAPGQGSAFWSGRADTLIATLRTELPQTCGLAETPRSAGAPAGGRKPASASCAEAQNDLARIERMDASTRAYLRDDQALPAADVVFSDLRDANQALITHVEELRATRAVDAAAVSSAMRTRQLATVGGAALFAVLILLLLTPRVTTVSAADADSSQAQTGNEADALLGAQPIHIGHLSIAHASPDRRSMPASAVAVADSVQKERRNEAPEVGAASWPPAPDVARTPDLGATAALCTDFAQLREPGDLRALLERLAKLLDASGIVVWLDEASSGELRAAASHGYPPQTLARMRGLSKDGDNATASAYRDRLLRVVPGENGGDGAIAVPLLAPGACVGVMSAEIRGGRESDRATQAIATIAAAQLATLVGAEPRAADSELSDFKLELDLDN